MSLLTGLICTALVLFAQGSWAAEKPAYAIVYKGSGYKAVKTEIFTIDLETAEKRVIFSDETTSIVIIQNLYVFHFPVTGGGRLFAHCAERGKMVPFPGNGYLYELSIDGSNRFRRICPVRGEESLGEIFVDSTGAKIGYLNRLNRKQYVFLHDVISGRLLSQIDLTDTLLDCYVSSIGWIPRCEKLYFSLETGDDHVTSEASYGRVGTYLMDRDGQQVKKLPALSVAKGFSPQSRSRMIGVLPTGQYLFEIMWISRQTSREQKDGSFALLKVKKDFTEIEDIRFNRSAESYSGLPICYRLSPSGKFISAARLPVSFSVASWNIWLKDLKTGKERKVLSLPTKGGQGPFLGLVGWLNQP